MVMQDSLTLIYNPWSVNFKISSQMQSNIVIWWGGGMPHSRLRSKYGSNIMTRLREQDQPCMKWMNERLFCHGPTRHKASLAPSWYQWILRQLSATVGNNKETSILGGKCQIGAQEDYEEDEYPSKSKYSRLWQTHQHLTAFEVFQSDREGIDCGTSIESLGETTGHNIDQGSLGILVVYRCALQRLKCLAAR